MTKKAWENHPGKKNITPPFQQIVNMMHCRKRNLFRQLFRRESPDELLTSPSGELPGTNWK